ncbi:hypothetical protein KIN20_034064 [Parelaphostrongylus tenuis]|uniref:Uncharacterized protein n=1 Tax=Parelaphostrongylus tenuis TaxID=148309 RepID=A0AAD5R929_PARTN|nr:hypothetical protein KIN20_034064 [Parelaphostrongylus tenuis]
MHVGCRISVNGGYAISLNDDRVIGVKVASTFLTNVANSASSSRPSRTSTPPDPSAESVNK